MARQRLEFPPNPAAEKLVADYLPAVIRAAHKWQVTYPHDDMEYIFVGALYRAAWTWRPDGGAGFWCWFLVKARGALTPLAKRAKRWEAGLKDQGATKSGRPRRRGPPIRISPISVEQVDSRYCWRQQHIQE